MDNQTLKQAIADAGLTAEQFADICEVNPRTVKRWLAGGPPYRRHRAKIARALDLTQHQLWPDDSPPPPDTEATRPVADPELSMDPAAAPALSEVIATWGSTRDRGAPGASAFLIGSVQRIDMLDPPSGLRYSPGLIDELRFHAREGTTIRVLIDELTEKLEPLLEEPGVELRVLNLQLVHTLLRADEQMLLGIRLVGDAGSPSLRLQRKTDHGLFDRITEHFQNCWDAARPTTQSTTPSAPPRRWPRTAS